MEKRYIIFISEENVGYSESFYSSMQLEGKDIYELFSKIVGIYKSEEKAQDKCKEIKHASYIEIEWEL